MAVFLLDNSWQNIENIPKQFLHILTTQAPAVATAAIPTNLTAATMQLMCCGCRNLMADHPRTIDGRPGPLS